MKGEWSMSIYESLKKSISQAIEYEKGNAENARVQEITVTNVPKTDSFGLSAFDIASWFISYNNSQESTDFLTNLKLQKLLYYAQGISIKYTGKTLFTEPICAMQYGPVVEEVYNKYKTYGRNPIDETIKIPTFENDVEVILEDVFDEYGQFSAGKLVDMTHHESPWLKTKRNHFISINKLKDFFAR